MVLGHAICLVPPAFAGWHLTVLRMLWQYVLSPSDAHMISFWLSHNNVVRSGIRLLWYFKHPQCKEFGLDLLINVRTLIWELERGSWQILGELFSAPPTTLPCCARLARLLAHSPPLRSL